MATYLTYTVENVSSCSITESPNLAISKILLIARVLEGAAQGPMSRLTSVTGFGRHREVCRGTRPVKKPNWLLKGSLEMS